MKKLMILLLLTATHSHSMQRLITTVLLRTQYRNVKVQQIHTAKTILSCKEPKGSTSWATYAEYLKERAVKANNHQEKNTQVKELLRLQKNFNPKSKLAPAPFAPEVLMVYTIAQMGFDDNNIYFVLKPKDPHSQLSELCDKIPVYDFLAHKQE